MYMYTTRCAHTEAPNSHVRFALVMAITNIRRETMEEQMFLSSFTKPLFAIYLQKLCLQKKSNFFVSHLISLSLLVYIVAQSSNRCLKNLFQINKRKNADFSIASRLVKDSARGTTLINLSAALCMIQCWRQRSDGILIEF